ncbi:unnamed protein product [Phytomonas sp. Hart1]|nr:unnamed protein product [Phytomonas sp. Hart1]|eukprot:CCW67014.1 unnamed protein product [Phytomonas sp. isolate Hart1]
MRCVYRSNGQNHNTLIFRRVLSPFHSTFCQISQLACVYRYYGSCTVVLRQSWAMNFIRPWMCNKDNCRKVNGEFRTSCEECATAKPNLLGWKCVKCQMKNHRGVKKCKSCGESFEASKDFWMCAACGENNRVDEIEDNSRCGYCSYDMAPLSSFGQKSEELLQMRAQENQQRQEAFDSISAEDADEQFGDVLSGHEMLPTELKTAAYSNSILNVKKLPLEEIKPFTVKLPETARSYLFRRSKPLDNALKGGIPPGPPGFDWMCRVRTCGHTNPGDEENCMKCGQHITPSEWECQQCAALNHLSRARCFNCFGYIPIHWTCEQCQTLTSVYEKACRQCGVEKTPQQPRNPSDIQGTFGSGRHNKRESNPPMRSDWYCEKCGCMNFSRRNECFGCKTPRDIFEDNTSQMNPYAPSTATLNANTNHQNWSCPGCRAANFRTRTTCWKCGGQAPSVITWAAESHTPHFEQEGFLKDEVDARPTEGAMNSWKKSDDWVCAKCFAKNFRSKVECFKCGSPKSMAVAPRRASVRKPVKL